MLDGYSCWFTRINPFESTNFSILFINRLTVINEDFPSHWRAESQITGSLKEGYSSTRWFMDTDMHGWQRERKRESESKERDSREREREWESRENDQLTPLIVTLIPCSHFLLLLSFIPSLPIPVYASLAYLLYSRSLFKSVVIRQALLARNGHQGAKFYAGNDRLAQYQLHFARTECRDNSPLVRSSVGLLQCLTNTV